jgi:hypothetical protein
VSRPGLGTYIRDCILFVAGLGIVVQQTGFPYLLESADKLSIPYLITGALFCNGPVVLQALTLRFGTASPGPSPASPLPGSSSESSSAPSPGGS